MDEYYFPQGYFGKGSDIKWCSRAHGGKRCMFCKHHAEFEEWSTEWKWYYLTSWYVLPYKCGWNDRDPRDATCIMKQLYTWCGWLPHGGQTKWTKATDPPRYRTPGILEHDMKMLLMNGCKEKRPCRCVKVIQRGNWYCPSCYYILERMAVHKQVDIHDLMISPLIELKEEVLILQLSGSL